MSNSQESREGNPINLGELLLPLLLLVLANQKRRKGSAELFALLRPKGATGRNQNWHWNWQWNWPPRRESNLAEERKKRKQKQKHKTQTQKQFAKSAATALPASQSELKPRKSPTLLIAISSAVSAGVAVAVDARTLLQKEICAD